MGFLKNLARSIFANNAGDGWITGGDYQNSAVSLGKIDDGSTKLSIVPLGKELIYIDKSDVQEFTTIESGAKWSRGNGNYIGNRYKVVLKDGKSFIMNIIANSTGRVEAYFML